mmetsp:Transcript_30846/g.73566  ORF Transcript_30846/g.73566 Transcript_30846/m.73566 type:complete len:213 (+) Transcript_30846:245-883(+)
MRVMPPTRSTSVMSLGSTPASLLQARQGARVLCKKESTICSSFDRVIWMFMCFGPLWSAVMKGRLTSVCTLLESSTLATSAASRRRCKANLSAPRSMPWDFLNSSTRYLTIAWSKSSPPKEVSPLVALTSKTPPEISKMEMSKVPPPRSYTARIWPSVPLSMPKARAAAVGSLMIRGTSRPAIFPASLVACRCASLKYAGTVTTAWPTLRPR